MHARDRRTHTEPNSKSFASAHAGADIGSHAEPHAVADDEPHAGADDEPNGKSFASAHAGADTGSHAEPYGEPNTKSDVDAHIITNAEPHASKELVLARLRLCQRQLLRPSAVAEQLRAVRGGAVQCRGERVPSRRLQLRHVVLAVLGGPLRRRRR